MRRANIGLYTDRMVLSVQESGQEGSYCLLRRQVQEDFLNEQGSLDVPLRYNNDKQKKPLFSRGLSVCRLLFNSFSKLKIDENYKEKRRLFY